MDVKNLKKQISEYRKWLRLGQVAVANYLEISKSAMSALESEESKRSIELNELLKLCKLFMCKPNDLMGSKSESGEIGAVFNTRKTNFDKDIDPRDKAEVDYFFYELKESMKSGKFTSKGKPKASTEIISLAAEELLERVKVKSIPVDVYSIAGQLGIFVKFSALTNLSGALVHATAENGPGVLLNSNQPENRLRFSLAHEIAHYFLGHYPERQESVSLLSDNAPIEKDANRFASELLMPRTYLADEIKKISGALNEIEVYKLSDKFAVSYQAMVVTLRNAGFISQAQFEVFNKLKVSELKDQVEKVSSPKYDFDPEIINSVLTENHFKLSSLDRDDIRLIQEMAYQKYVEKYSIELRATPVKDVYEKVVFWLVEKREEVLGKSFIDSVMKTLTSNNIDVVDKTHNGGCLWVVSSPESDAVIEILRRKNIDFKFASKGGKATKGKPAWYLSMKQELVEE